MSKINLQTLTQAMKKGKIKLPEVSKLILDESGYNFETSTLFIKGDDKKFEIILKEFNVMTGNLSNIDALKEAFNELHADDTGAVQTPAVAVQAPKAVEVAPAPVAVQAEEVVNKVVAKAPKAKGKIFERLGMTEREWRKYTAEEKKYARALLDGGDYNGTEFPGGQWDKAFFEQQVESTRLAQAQTTPAVATQVVSAQEVPAITPEVANAPHISQATGAVDMITPITPITIPGLDNIPGL